MPDPFKSGALTDTTPYDISLGATKPMPMAQTQFPKPHGLKNLGRGLKNTGGKQK